MKIHPHTITRSLCALLVSSSALVAATSGASEGGPTKPVPVLPRTINYVVPPGTFTERDAGTPISIPINKNFRLLLTTDTNEDPINSFWRPADSNRQTFTLIHEEKTTDIYFNLKNGEGAQLSSTIFVYHPIPADIGPTELSFELVSYQNMPGGQLTVIRTVSFPMNIVEGDNSPSPAHSIVEGDNSPSDGDITGTSPNDPSPSTGESPE